MKPSRDVRNMYKSVVTDLLYKEPDKWSYVNVDSDYNSYLSYSGDNMSIKYYLYHFRNNLTISLINGNWFVMGDNRNITKLAFKMVEEINKNKQKKLDSLFFDAIPFTTRRRLKIQKIYRNIV